MELEGDTGEGAEVTAEELATEEGNELTAEGGDGLTTGGGTGLTAELGVALTNLPSEHHRSQATRCDHGIRKCHSNIPNTLTGALGSMGEAGAGKVTGLTAWEGEDGVNADMVEGMIVAAQQWEQELLMFDNEVIQELAEGMVVGL